ncbi:MAG TPA: carboxypeptidase-like regulatory domain-containing protein, partial [Longimicrobiales bacterium]|nr:carboxypeptidase-like regulatory domain-containing protein [Longimicrobiales bacterium]
MLLLVSALVPAIGATRAQPQRADGPLGLSGYVLAPDLTPVSGGSVVLQSAGGRATTVIDGAGRFRLVPDRDGLHQLFVSVPGFAPYRITTTVPPSRTLKQPVIRLWPASYFRVRFVSAAGEVITAPRLRRQSLDAPPDHQVPEQIDGDGTMTIGPLPLGRTLVAFDAAFFAQTRLPDLDVTHEGQLLDGGTVVVQSGAVLHVDVVDESGAPLPAHDVSLEDARPESSLMLRPAGTNAEGRATFDRLGAGRYRLRTSTAGPCDYRPLSIARIVSVPGSGTLHTRLVAGGTATLRLGSPVGPLSGTSVSASPDPDLSPPPPLPRNPLEFGPFVRRPLGPFRSRSSCGGTTDADGRVTFLNFPPGPARIDVRLPNSTYVRLVGVPDDPREIAVHIPEGFLPVRVMNALENEPVAGAAITWTGGGARVEARSSANGHALLEGIGDTAGTLEVTASGYERTGAKLSAAPASLHEVALRPALATGLQPRVITSSGEPVGNAVVEVSSESPTAVGHVAVTDAKGFARFLDPPAGALRLSASADGFVTAVARVSEDSRREIVLTLSRGYRIIARVELPPEDGVHVIRVLNDAGASLESSLDTASDRAIQPPGQLSLGPLAPGTYVIELQGARG